MANTAPGKFAVPFAAKVVVGATFGQPHTVISQSDPSVWFGNALDAIDGINVGNVFATLNKNGSFAPVSGVISDTGNSVNSIPFYHAFSGAVSSVAQPVIPQNAVMFAHVVPAFDPNNIENGGQLFSETLGSWEGPNFSSRLKLLEALIRNCAFPTAWGNRATFAAQPFLRFFDSALPLGAIELNSELTFGDNVEAAINAAKADIEIEEPTISPGPTLPAVDPNSPWSVTQEDMTIKVPATVTAEINGLFVARISQHRMAPHHSGTAYVLLTKAEIDAIDAEVVRRMETYERLALDRLHRATRDGLTSADLTGPLAGPPAAEDSRMSEQMSTRYDAWRVHWQNVIAKAFTEANNPSRLDSRYQQYLATNPTNPVSRATFDLDPTQYLPDSVFRPTSPEAIDKSWWTKITDGLSWLGQETVGLLKSTDTSTLATLFTAGAGMGWFGKNAQMLAIAFIAILLLK